jgi:voltage-gated potassium channel
MTNKKNFFKDKLFQVIFQVDTPAGRMFDSILLWSILLSLLGVMLESVTGFRAEYATVLKTIELIFTFVFTLEYLLRLYCARSVARYAKSFFGVIDLLAIVPTYISLAGIPAYSLLFLRALRLLRIFRVLKLARYVKEMEILGVALRAARFRILTFVSSVLTIVIIIGSAMYLIEGEHNGFTSIPRAMYWAIVTMTTVGYGDIAPQTFLGQTLSSLLMVIGYGIIVVPAGIFSAEVALAKHDAGDVQKSRPLEEHDNLPAARFCSYCGKKVAE